MRVSNATADRTATELAERLQTLRPVDHHVHGCWLSDGSRGRFENALNEANTDPLPGWDSAFDTQLGFAVRAHCAPLLGLPAHADPDAYWRRRDSIGEAAVAERLLPAAGIQDWLVDTGFGRDICSPEQLARVAGGTARTVLRLESVAEQALTSGPDYARNFADLLAAETDRQGAVGFKTVIAYRTGFAIDWSEPSPSAVNEAARRWADSGGRRLADPLLLCFGIRTALALQARSAGLPVQFHVGFGDRDEDLGLTDPLLLLPLLRDPIATNASIALLHCYPYERQAGYLAQAFAGVHLDVGLAVNHLGGRSKDLLARSLELAPFRKLLYSSDAYGPAELHYLGAHLWRAGTAAVLASFVDDGHWSLADALRIADLIASTNARRLYRL
ncbi:amidohydrolase family protein [Microlunatus sp. Gsoil 973]|uniref:amidohydrolase family protein n=1 Tax=Microlunatus sp. Gsoil 973 TaxID=2672569 RepID=UPI0012B4832E|nr:amidohydrolase family protein [Microlunatus sp. Gsoil 973]QGN32171.1 amidohydrolase family protein [Microlunatus sp. Gsoil 973]